MNIATESEAFADAGTRAQNDWTRIACVALVLTLGCARTAVAQTAATPPFEPIPQTQLQARFAAELGSLGGKRVSHDKFEGVRKVKLAYLSVLVPNARAAVVIVSGRAENLLKYQEIIGDLVRQNYSVYVYDHRGQGFSDRLLPSAPQKGHVQRFDDYVDDLQRFVDQVVRRDQHKHLLVLAHSMGGGIATRHLQRYPGVFAAAALSSPMHQPNAKILISADSSCRFFKQTGGIASDVWAGGMAKPYVSRPYDAKTNEYTHSPARWARGLQVENEYPRVRIGGPTLGWAAEACSASTALLAETGKIVTPVLVLQAGEDTAVMPDAQNRFCAALLDNTKRPCDGGGPQRIEGARHELLIEDDLYRSSAMLRIFEFFARHQVRSP